MKTDNRIKELQNEIAIIKQRNQKVEAEKAWEVSLERKIALAALTFFFVLFVFLITKTPSPLFNAIVSTLGFLLSTLSLDSIKKYWLKLQKKK